MISLSLSLASCVLTAQSTLNPHSRSIRTLYISSHTSVTHTHTHTLALFHSHSHSFTHSATFVLLFPTITRTTVTTVQLPVPVVCDAVPPSQLLCVFRNRTVNMPGAAQRRCQASDRNRACACPRPSSRIRHFNRMRERRSAICISFVHTGQCYGRAERDICITFLASVPLAPVCVLS